VSAHGHNSIAVNYIRTDPDNSGNWKDTLTGKERLYSTEFQDYQR